MTTQSDREAANAASAAETASNRPGAASPSEGPGHPDETATANRGEAGAAETDASPTSDATAFGDAADGAAAVDVDAGPQTDGGETPTAPQAAEPSEVQELRNQLLRTLADFDNFRRRTRQEKEELQQFATRKLLADLLPVVDNFERALASANGAGGEASDVLTGVEMVHRQLLSVLQAYGVVPMEAVGKPFDPNIHEAVAQEANPEAGSGVVLAEFQKGYRLHDKVLRPAMVKVSV
ncbi:MAG: nucleotide exchange factor GrpE [Alicyclobacillus sp.]|nr:nucleotide exchange factor GrpE [Alicyclobacillus sp.]